MPLFAITCQDQPGALDLRLATRPDHLAYLKTQDPLIRLAGPQLDDEGKPCGSLFVIETADKAAAEAFCAGDPYGKAGLFATVHQRLQQDPGVVVLTQESNPARPAPGEALCLLDEIADPGGKGFDFRVGEALFLGFVVRRGNEALGYVDSCPHAGWPLAAAPDRYLTRDGAHIFCGGHGAVFRIDDGMCLAGPCADQALGMWPVWVDAEGVVRTA